MMLGHAVISLLGDNQMIVDGDGERLGSLNYCPGIPVGSGRGKLAAGVVVHQDQPGGFVF